MALQANVPANERAGSGDATAEVAGCRRWRRGCDRRVCRRCLRFMRLIRV